MSNFYRWFADEANRLATYIRAKKRAESREKEAFERFQNEGRGKYPRDDGRKTVRLAFSLRVLKKNLAHKTEEASAQVERRFMASIVDSFDIVTENHDIGFMLGRLNKEDRHGF